MSDTQQKHYPPPADAKEWTCKTCGMDCLWCGCPASAPPRPPAPPSELIQEIDIRPQLSDLFSQISGLRFNANMGEQMWGKGGRDSFDADIQFFERVKTWGNPHVVGPCPKCGHSHTRVMAIDLFLAGLTPELIADARAELRGKDLVCWCAPKACHADVLLDIANS